MLNTIHLEALGKTARVLYQSLPNQRPKPQMRMLTRAGEVSAVRLVTGVNAAIDPAQLTFQDLLENDPELTPAAAGEVLEPENLSTAYYNPADPQPRPAADFKEINIVYDPAGSETERRPYTRRSRNIDDVYPVKMGKKMPLEKGLTAFVFKQFYQLVHEDGLTKDFLFQIAEELHREQALALLGAGPKGNQPLVVRDGGTPFRAFLFGEIGTGEEAGKYKLLLMLTDQELKRPVPKEKSA